MDKEELTPLQSYDVVIVGTGIAGLYTALSIESTKNILLISKGEIEDSASNLAQAGISACKDPDVHYKDTMKAGAYYNNPDSVKILSSEAEKNINNLINLGVNFDRDEKGQLSLTIEGGHSGKNVLHYRDETGKEIIRSLRKQVTKRKNIQVLTKTFVVDIIKENNLAKGVTILWGENQERTIDAQIVVLATGGVGELYGKTSNPSITTGDGIAMAHRAGVKIIDMEFIQFHPTAFYSKDNHKRLLISEAVRGEGGVLKNLSHQSFMKKYDHRAELAPRDIVARAIFKEMKETHSNFVYLDITHMDDRFIQNRFPMIYEKCLKNGIDITKTPIPVAPAAHYIMGGILTDYNGRTDINGLYACGECACTKVHGANRLASNSLLEGVVFGQRVATHINKSYSKSLNSNENREEIISYINKNKEEKGLSAQEEKNANRTSEKIKNLREELKVIMDQYASIVRNQEELLKALKGIEKIHHDLRLLLKSTLTLSIEDKIACYEVENMLTVSRLTVKAALTRDESIGAHYKE